MSYGLVVIDRHAKNTRGLPIEEVRDADVIVGKGRTVLKHRRMPVGARLSEGDLAELREDAEELRER